MNVCLIVEEVCEKICLKISNLSLQNEGVDDKSFGFGGTGKKSWNRKFDDYGETFDAGDVIGCLVDRENETISFCKNGRDLGTGIFCFTRMGGI